MKRSVSMGSISHNHSYIAKSLDGYNSDDLDHGFTVRHQPQRKRGVSWTEQEHRQFLLGLEKLGRGNWRAISRNYVSTRTPSQVASHAQKYFIRKSNANEPGKRKRRSILDLAPNTGSNSSQPVQFSIPSPLAGSYNGGLPFSSLQAARTSSSPPSLDLSLKPPFTPLPFQLWPPNAYPVNYGGGTSQHQIHRPVPAVREEPIKELVGMSQLKLGETSRVQIETSP